MVNLSLSVLIKKVLIKKGIIQDIFNFFPSLSSGQDDKPHAVKKVPMMDMSDKDLERIKKMAKL